MADNEISPELKRTLGRGMVIPAHPLALNAARQLDERRQRALSRYYLSAGAGGLAVGVHTTQFSIRDPAIGLYEPVLTIASEEMNRAEADGHAPIVRVAGICGLTNQAVEEASSASRLGYQLGLLNLSALQGSTVPQLVQHCKAVSDVITLFGFYLQGSVGGIELPYDFWRAFCEIDNVAAIKVAAFDRYRTIDVVRAVAESGRDDIALYTGNDDSIVMDLLAPYEFRFGDHTVTRRFVGGLLGHWAIWTLRAVEFLNACQQSNKSKDGPGWKMLQLGHQVTDANAVVFDAGNQFRGCIPGIHEVLRRQGLLEGCWCLDESEVLSPGQSEELDRIIASYPHLTDDQFVEQNRDQWLSG